MTADVITFVSHTNKPGGGELALRRYLEVTDLPVQLVVARPGGVWEGLPCDVVHAPNPLRLFWALSAGGPVVANSMRAALMCALVSPPCTPLVYWVRDGLTDSAMSPTALTLTKCLTARRVHHYFANSRWTAATVYHALGVPESDVTVVHSMCGVGRRDLQRAARSRPLEPLRLLYLGRISPWKAPHVAVEATQQLRDQGLDAELTIAGGVHFGEDDYGAKLQARVRDLPYVNWLGHVTEVGVLLESHDLLLHTSVRPEPFGQVIIQGLAAGLPVLATDAGGPQEILAGAPVSSLYAPGDVSALVARVRAVCDRYPEVSGWALARARPFVDEELAARTDRAFHRIFPIEQLGT